MNFFKKILSLLILSPSLCLGATNTVQPIATTPTIAYPSVTSVSPPSGISNENYQSLPTCNSVNLAHCPDINGNPPRSVSVTTMNQDCPQYCTVTRTVSGSGWTLQSKDAVCPVGYASVANFNVQWELKQYTTAQTIQPIIGLTAYNCYANPSNGYMCTATGPYRTWETGCNSDPNYSTGQILDNMPGASPPGVVVKITNKSGRTCWCKGSSCSLHCLCGAAHDETHTYTYSPIKCTAFGLAATCTTYTPTTLVCALVAPKWGTH